MRQGSPVGHPRNPSRLPLPSFSTLSVRLLSFYPISHLLPPTIWSGKVNERNLMRDAADYARWDARDSGGNIDVFDQQGQLFRKISVKADALADSAFVLPSA